jgi:hypothetical protein
MSFSATVYHAPLPPIPNPLVFSTSISPHFSMPMPSGVVKLLNSAASQLNTTIQNAVNATGNPKIVAVDNDAAFKDGWLCTASGKENIGGSLFNGLEADGAISFSNTNSFPLYLPWILNISKTWAGTTKTPTNVKEAVMSWINPQGFHPNPDGHAVMAKTVIASLP